ncbi:hypothetical protein [Paraburkholderia sp. C35]|uniref:hypothetical protein n=1 Tax=Paraburkholderia sp. C35 TaxID=2126993 RepID=UPI000D6861A2|nr:hypothetical protein [Paraburkholderia sp. C35]
MTTTALSLIPDATLTTSDAAYYTSPNNTTSVLKRTVFTNTSASAVTVTVNVVRSGGSSVTTNVIIPPYAIAAGKTYVSPELAGMTLGPGDSIHALASANSAINMMSSGIQIV